MNIINSKQMTVNVNILIIDSCQNIKMDLFSFKKSSIKKIVMCASTIIVLAYINMKISVVLRDKKTISNRDYMYLSNKAFRFDCAKKFSHIVNSNFFEILIINNSNYLITIFKRFRLNIIEEFEEKNCYIVSSHDVHFVVDN